MSNNIEYTSKVFC